MKYYDQKIFYDIYFNFAFYFLTLSRDNKNFLKADSEIKNVKDFESIEDQVSRIIFLATQ